MTSPAESDRIKFLWQCKSHALLVQANRPNGSNLFLHCRSKESALEDEDKDEDTAIIKVFLV